jgi:hypothetical protein
LKGNRKRNSFRTGPNPNHKKVKNLPNEEQDEDYPRKCEYETQKAHAHHQDIRVRRMSGLCFIGSERNERPKDQIGQSGDDEPTGVRNGRVEGAALEQKKQSGKPT